MKILHSADWHINLNKKKVPYAWSKNRFELLFSKIYELEQKCDIHIISGDIFDKEPTPDEVCLFLSFANSVSIPTYIIPGNHEATSKGKSFFDYFLQDNVVTNSKLSIITQNYKTTILGQPFYFFPYGEMQIDNLLKYDKDEVMVTHIRGEIPPHVTAEYDFDKLKPWKLILLGDLHFFHRYKTTNAWYSGSPINTTFDRNDNNSYGVSIVDFDNIDKYKVNFVDLKLPKLLRKTIKAGNDMIASDIDHCVYEITGSIDELAKVSNSALLDKKIAVKPNEHSKINLQGMSIVQELEAYLKYNEVEEISEILDEFKNINMKGII